MHLGELQQRQYITTQQLNFTKPLLQWLFLWAFSSVVERQALTLYVVGSIPTTLVQWAYDKQLY